MDLFEQLGEKLTGAGQNVAQQTKNLTDVARLNNAISGKERAIAKLYTDIGRAYWERHKDDPSAEELQLVSEVSRLCGEIEECRETIRKIKGVAKCPSCGADVPVGSLFCSACGQKMTPAAAPVQAAEPQTKTCPNCHANVNSDSAFCVFCGAKIDG